MTSGILGPDEASGEGSVASGHFRGIAVHGVLHRLRGTVHRGLPHHWPPGEGD